MFQLSARARGLGVSDFYHTTPHSEVFLAPFSAKDHQNGKLQLSISPQLFSGTFFFGGCPLKTVFPKAGSLFFPGSLNN